MIEILKVDGTKHAAKVIMLLVTKRTDAFFILRHFIRVLQDERNSFSSKPVLHIGGMWSDILIQKWKSMNQRWNDLIDWAILNVSLGFPLVKTFNWYLMKYNGYS